MSFENWNKFVAETLAQQEHRAAVQGEKPPQPEQKRGEQLKHGKEKDSIRTKL
jgi:hypothetical protein